jgi:hypothetical protein
VTPVKYGLVLVAVWFFFGVVGVAAVLIGLHLQRRYLT